MAAWQYDMLLVGGGLANGLIAARMSTKDPQLSIAIIEMSATLGGRHTWSFFENDVSLQQFAWLQPFVSRTWLHYDVAFPRYRRRLVTPYHSIRSEHFDAVLRAVPSISFIQGTAARVEEHIVQMSDGRIFTGRAVIDGRGPEVAPEMTVAFQKFLGCFVSLHGGHGLSGPMLMDATVEQSGGYRFMYVLPFSEDTLLIEDTCYSTDLRFNRPAIRSQIKKYADKRGWRIRTVVSEEEGVLPIALDGNIEMFWKRRAGRCVAGLRAALYHPTTGYSLPDAVDVADTVAGLSELSTADVARAIETHSRAAWHKRWFFRLLNRMMFRAASDRERYAIFQRFYEMPEGLIRRFYSAELRVGDRLRLISGRPPVSIFAALPCILPKRRHS